MELVAGHRMGDGARAADSPVRRSAALPGRRVQATQERHKCGPHRRVFGHDIAERARREVGGGQLVRKLDRRPHDRVGARDTGRRFAMVNGAVNYFSVAASLPEARGVFMGTGDLIRLWEGPRRVFLVVRRPRAESVVAALPAARVHEIGRDGSRWLYSHR